MAQSPHPSQRAGPGSDDLTNTISLEGLAELSTYSLSTLYALIDRGVLPPSQRGRVPLIQSIHKLFIYARKGGADEADDLQELIFAKRREDLGIARAKREKMELDNAIKRKQFIPYDHVRILLGTAFRSFQTRLRAIPRKVTPAIRAAATDGNGAEILNDELMSALTMLGRMDLTFEAPDTDDLNLDRVDAGSTDQSGVLGREEPDEAVG